MDDLRLVIVYMLKYVVNFIALLALTGCAINEIGSVRVRYFENETVFIICKESWGGYLSTDNANAGFTLGHAEAAAIILSDANNLSGHDFVYIRNLIAVLNGDSGNGVEDAKTILAELSIISEQIRPDNYPVTTYRRAGLQKELTERHKIHSINNHEKILMG